MDETVFVDVARTGVDGRRDLARIAGNQLGRVYALAADKSPIVWLSQAARLPGLHDGVAADPKLDAL